MLAFAPLVVVGTAVLVFAVDLPPLSGLAGSLQSAPGAWFAAYWLLSIFKAVAFSFHALRNERIEHRSRMSWVAAFALASPVVAPMYWFKGLAAPR